MLPELVHGIARDGGRVDITYRGEPKVSILRVSDVRRGSERRVSQHRLPPALRVELLNQGDLVDVIRGLRSRHGHPRRNWLVDNGFAVQSKGRSKRRRPKR